MLLKSNFHKEGEVGELVCKIESVSLEDVDPKGLFVEGGIVRNIELLGLFCDL